MCRNPLTDKEKKIILEKRLIASSGQIALQIGRSKFAVQRFLKAAGMTPPKEVIERFRTEALSGRTTSTKKIDKYLQTHYLHTPVKVMAKAIKKSHTFVVTRMRQLGIAQPQALRDEFRQRSLIKPGNVPATKGKKWKDFMSKEGMRNSRKTTFKKGQLPKNTKYNGCISARKDTKSGIVYNYIRLKLGWWMPLHQHIWRKANGRIKKGFIVVFKDGNTMNCKLANLELISLKENMLRNTLHNLPKPIAQVIQLRGALNRQIKKHEKQNKRSA